MKRNDLEALRFGLIAFAAFLACVLFASLVNAADVKWDGGQCVAESVSLDAKNEVTVVCVDKTVRKFSPATVQVQCAVLTVVTPPTPTRPPAPPPRTPSK